MRLHEDFIPLKLKLQWQRNHAQSFKKLLIHKLWALREFSEIRLALLLVGIATFLAFFSQ